MKHIFPVLFISLLVSVLSLPQEAAAESRAEEYLDRAYGYISGAMLFLAFMPWIARMVLKRRNLPTLERWNRTFFRRYHMVFGVGALGFALLHEYLHGRCNLAVEAGLYLMEILALTGILVSIKLPKKLRLAILRAHRIGIWGVISFLLITVGHVYLIW
jgi:hypothetical protein